jgi:hypothetical protein
MRFGISPIVSGEDVNDSTPRTAKGSQPWEPAKEPGYGKTRPVPPRAGRLEQPRRTGKKAAVSPPRQHPFGRRDIARAWIKRNSRTEHALDALVLDSAVVMRHTLFAYIERSFFFKRKPSREPLNTHMILVP